MLPKGDLDAYTDGSLMAGRSGAGAVIYKKRQAICHVHRNTGAATVYQSELLGIKAVADVLLSQGFMGRSIVFHVDNQAALQSLNGNDITKNCARLAREALNKLELTTGCTWTGAGLMLVSLGMKSRTTWPRLG
jgi:hypothetical protein